LSIVSFVVKDPAGGPSFFLHHNLVVAVLNDLFGIQSRGGCSCAGPYGHRLLGIDLDRSHEFEREITRGCEGIKPGWVRVNFNYFIDEMTFDYIVSAVELIADRGAALLPQYRFEPDSGLWTHRSGRGAPPRSLLDIDYSSGQMQYQEHAPGFETSDLRDYLDEAARILDAAVDDVAGAERPATNADFEHLRWFRYPDEGGSGAAGRH
ncbi:MAG: hypothetical protein KDB16_20395, partial [Acidimicrobiales bacterium]|nr:hypothetical protein [Acidimicrobiales bacterium]